MHDDPAHHRPIETPAPVTDHSSSAPAGILEGWYVPRVIPVLVGVLVSFGCGNKATVDDSNARVSGWEAWADAVALPNDDLNGWVDTTYRFVNANPAYAEDGGPTVCVRQRLI